MYTIQLVLLCVQRKDLVLLLCTIVECLYSIISGKQLRESVSTSTEVLDSS